MHLDPNAWRYDAARPVRTLSQLPAGLIHTGSLIMLAQELRAYGGKALGLRICDQLARDSRHLRVPEWIAVDPSEMNSERVWDHAGEVSGSLHPVVLQEYVEGIGLVVDLAYSQLLERTIVRASTGREQTLADGRRRFTSATHDSEGCHFVIDPLTGRFLTPCAQGNLFTQALERLPVRELARELYARVCQAEIGFGVQAVPERIHDDLLHALNEKPRVLRVVSDGLVGQIALLS